MRILVIEAEPIAIDVTFTTDAFRVTLDDGRELSIPLVWFPRLQHANSRQRKNWELIGRGEGLHWEDLDEDISIAGLLAGRGVQTQSQKKQHNPLF